MQTLIELAKNNGIDKLKLAVPDKEKRVYRVYRKLESKEAGRKKISSHHWASPISKGCRKVRLERCLIMEKEFKF